MIADKCTNCNGLGYVIDEGGYLVSKKCRVCDGQGFFFYADETQDNFSTDYNPREDNGN